MAIIFANHISSLGYDCLVFGHPNLKKSDYDFETTQDITYFSENIDVLMFGGGGYLVPNPTPNAFFDRIGQLVEICKQRSVPIGGFSMGGIGGQMEQLNPNVQELVKTADVMSLRTTPDTENLSQYNNNIEFNQDIVWLTPKLFPFSSIGISQENGRPKVGLCFRRRRYRWPIMKLAILFLVSYRRDLDFVFIDLTADESEFKGLRLESSRPNCTYYWCKDPVNAIEKIASLDLLVSSTLHLGMAATAFGIPNVGLFADKKARMGFRMAGLVKYKSDLLNDAAFYWSLLSKKRTKALMESQSKWNLSEIQKSAENTFNMIAAFLKSSADQSEKSSGRASPSDV